MQSTTRHAPLKHPNRHKQPYCRVEGRGVGFRDSPKHQLQKEGELEDEEEDEEPEEEKGEEENVPMRTVKEKGEDEPDGK